MGNCETKFRGFAITRITTMKGDSHEPDIRKGIVCFK